MFITHAEHAQIIKSNNMCFIDSNLGVQPMLESACECLKKGKINLAAGYKH